MHPWHAHEVKEGWLERLRGLLQRHPAAVIGEIGVDKAAKAPSSRRCEWASQQEVFKAQMALASELWRPVSMHCVRAPGMLLEFLRQCTGSLPQLPVLQ